MSAFIDPPAKYPLFLRLGIWISRKVTGKDLLPARLLAWYPKAAIGSGVLESLVAHGKKDLNPRILQLVRMQVSVVVSCPFCMDMNSFEYQQHAITAPEISALQGETDIEAVPTFSAQEKLALKYARLLSQTPLAVPPEFGRTLAQHFTERELVILASTAAQVNYWARLIQGLGIPPAGFSDNCPLK